MLFAVEAGCETVHAVVDYLRRAGVPGLLTVGEIGSILRRLNAMGAIRYYTVPEKPLEFRYVLTANGAKKCSWWRARGEPEP